MISFEGMSARFAAKINSGTGSGNVNSVVTGFAMEKETAMTTVVVFCERTRRCTAIIAGKEPTDWSDFLWKIRNQAKLRPFQRRLGNGSKH